MKPQNFRRAAAFLLCLCVLCAFFMGTAAALLHSGVEHDHIHDHGEECAVCHVLCQTVKILMAAGVPALTLYGIPLRAKDALCRRAYGVFVVRRNNLATCKVRLNI